MFKFVFPATVLATLVLSGVMTAEAAPDAARYALSGGNTAAVSQYQSRMPLAGSVQGRLLQIRDARSANGSGNGCWNACFTDFDECMGIRTKNLCVSRVKTCLETCERLSSRPGM